MTGEMWNTAHHMHWVMASVPTVPAALRMLAEAIEEQSKVDRFITTLAINLPEKWEPGNTVTCSALVEDWT